VSELVHRWPICVYYEDTDAAGIVYYANYLKFMERARTEFLRTLGFSQRALAERLGLRFAVVAAELRFRHPARLDDRLIVATKILRCRRASVDFAQRILREEDEALLVEGVVRVAAINAAGRAAPLPFEVRKAFERHRTTLEGAMR